MRIKICLTIIFCALLSSCATVSQQPSNTENLCTIFKEYPGWKAAAYRTQQRWHVPIEVQMSIINQESSFIGDAKPSRQYILGFIPGARPTSACGYSQAVNATWRLYQRSTGLYDADRYNFSDASDFVGWYASRAHARAGIPLNNAYALYLAYHQGITNYMNRTYATKPWLMRVAAKVQMRANVYQKQLARCFPNLLPPPIHVTVVKPKTTRKMTKRYRENTNYPF